MSKAIREDPENTREKTPPLADCRLKSHTKESGVQKGVEPLTIYLPHESKSVQLC